METVSPCATSVGQSGVKVFFSCEIFLALSFLLMDFVIVLWSLRLFCWLPKDPPWYSKARQPTMSNNFHVSHEKDHISQGLIFAHSLVPTEFSYLHIARSYTYNGMRCSIYFIHSRQQIHSYQTRQRYRIFAVSVEQSRMICRNSLFSQSSC